MVRAMLRLTALLLLKPSAAMAHASEQGFVLLLPTRLYNASGVAAVALTVLLLAVLPARALWPLFASRAVAPVPPDCWRRVAGWLSFGIFAALILAGLTGPRDPLANPLPLAVWTLFWIGLVTLQALLGDLWSWANPWHAPLALVRRLAPRPRRMRWGTWAGTLTFLGFAAFLLADPAPQDPRRLALVAGAYWLVHFALALVFGARWLRWGEGLTLALTALARLGAFARRGRLRAGLPGWQIARHRFPPGLAPVCVLLLGAGSFDGLHETFVWLTLLGVNPFEYPGRTALAPLTLGGLLAVNSVLAAVLALCLAAGLRLAGSGMSLREGLARFAPSLLPIALGYHVAHYLPGFLVDGQHALVALSDPLHRGTDLLGLGEHFVSTGFFNNRASVRLIYLAQAGAVVAGHVLAVLLAHALALREFGGHARAALSQAPLAAFMIGYTLFGLWLLATPRL